MNRRSVFGTWSTLSLSWWAKEKWRTVTRNHAYRNVEAVCNGLHVTQHRMSRPHLDAITSTHQFRCRTQRPGSSSRHQSCQLHHLVIAPSTHHKTAMSSPVALCKRTWAGFNNGSPRLLQSAKRHHVFLSTRVHDHIPQVSRFVKRDIRVVANRQSVRRDSRNVANWLCPHVLNFSLLFRLSGFRFDSPSTCVPTRRSTNLAQMTTLATETATFVSTRAIKSSMTDLTTTTALVCVSTARAAFARTLGTLPEGLDLPADFSRCLHIALRCSVLPQLLHFAEPSLSFFFLSFSLSLCLAIGFPMHAFFAFYLKSKIIMRNVGNRGFKHCENTFIEKLHCYEPIEIMNKNLCLLVYFALLPVAVSRICFLDLLKVSIVIWA